MSKMSTRRHLRELQWRMMLVAAFFIIGACLAYNFQAALIPFILDPLHGEKLVYLNPAGGFSFIFLISIYSGIALSFPVLVQQIYAFLRPALAPTVRKKSSIIIISSFLLLVAGVAFGYFIAVPNALSFLFTFADQYVNASLTADSYLNFIIAYTIGIGVVFQLPLLLLLINTIHPLTPGGLLRSERWVILVAFIVAAIITPTPDPINQAIIAVPVIAVYQIGVIAVMISIARTKRRSKKAARYNVAAAKAAQAESTPKIPMPVAQSIQPEITARTAQPQRPRVVDGFTQVPRTRLQVPTRQTPPQRSTPRTTEQTQRSAPPKGLYVDGIIASTRATA